MSKYRVPPEGYCSVCRQRMWLNLDHTTDSHRFPDDALTFMQWKTCEGSGRPAEGVTDIYAKQSTSSPNRKQRTNSRNTIA